MDRRAASVSEESGVVIRIAVIRGKTVRAALKRLAMATAAT